MMSELVKYENDLHVHNYAFLCCTHSATIILLPCVNPCFLITIQKYGYSVLNFTTFSCYPIVFFSSYYLVATSPVRAQERRRLKVMRPPIHNPTKLNTAHIQPRSQLHQCVGGNAVHLATLVSAHCAQPDTGVAGAPVAAGYNRACVRTQRTQSLWWHSWRWSTSPLTTAPPGRPQKYVFFLQTSLNVDSE
jgi:hypothetical protein